MQNWLSVDLWLAVRAFSYSSTTIEKVQGCLERVSINVFWETAVHKIYNSFLRIHARMARVN